MVRVDGVFVIVFVIMIGRQISLLLREFELNSRDSGAALGGNVLKKCHMQLVGGVVWLCWVEVKMHLPALTILMR